MENTKVLTGAISKILYFDTDSIWGIYKLESGKTIKGNARFELGETVHVRVAGEEIRAVEKVEPPKENKTLRDYLSSKPDIGKAAAQRFVRLFPDATKTLDEWALLFHKDQLFNSEFPHAHQIREYMYAPETIEKIQNILSPEAVLMCNNAGIEKQKIIQLVYQWRRGSQGREVVRSLLESDFGTSGFLSFRECEDVARNTLGPTWKAAEFRAARGVKGVGDVLTVLHDNPYVFCDVLDIGGWEKMDKRLQEFKLGTQEQRTNSAAMWIVSPAKIGGFCVPEDIFKKRLGECLGTKGGVEVSVGIVRSGGMVYHPKMWDMEATLVNILNSFHGSSSTSELRRPPQLAEEQWLAVRNALVHPFSIINGKAGTGKTTVIKYICDSLADTGSDIFLMAPTGKAAVRISEKTRLEATTMHSRYYKLLMQKKIQGAKVYGDGPAAIIIIDEASMIEAEIFIELLGLVNRRVSRLILIGDAAQLPPVGRGRIFQDLTESNVPIVTLKQIHRQKEDTGGGILRNASIVHDSPDSMYNEKLASFLETKDSKGFKWISEGDADDMVKAAVIEFVLGPPGETQVIVPRKNKTDVNAESLNHILREIANPANPSRPSIPSKVKSAPELWRLNDRVICSKNQYAEKRLLVANGEQGIITGLDIVSGNWIQVDFGGQEKVVFWRPGTRDGDTDDFAWTCIRHAYAITVHKSQGSEWKKVVFILGPQTGRLLLTRKMLYTGMTRASEELVLVGSPKTIGWAMGNDGELDEGKWSQISKKRLSFKVG